MVLTWETPWCAPAGRWIGRSTRTAPTPAPRPKPGPRSAASGPAASRSHGNGGVNGEGHPSMALFWLVYEQEGVGRCVVIEEASSLVIARLKASMAHDGIDSCFVEGHELPGQVSKLKPAVGRLMPALAAA